MIVVERWIASGAPGRNRIRAGRRAVERYDQLMRCHVLPALGSRSLQQLQAIEIDALYAGLTSKLKPRTAHHVHTVFNACLVTAERKGLVAANPMACVEKLPSPGRKRSWCCAGDRRTSKAARGISGIDPLRDRLGYCLHTGEAERNLGAALDGL
jgi:hypothetical protein